jgi:hypothetical protein
MNSLTTVCARRFILRGHHPDLARRPEDASITMQLPSLKSGGYHRRQAVQHRE